MKTFIHVCQGGQTDGWHAVDLSEPWTKGVPTRMEVGYRVVLGRLFIDDHLGRDLPFGLVVSENSRTYTLLMSADDIREVYSDACHYGDGGMCEEYERENRDVVQAARRVMAALEKQVPQVL